jgi:hypothetical protein
MATWGRKAFDGGGAGSEEAFEMSNRSLCRGAR